MKRKAIIIAGVLALATSFFNVPAYANEAVETIEAISPAIAPTVPTQLEPTGNFETSHDGTSNFTFSPYYFKTRPLVSAVVGAQASTNFRLEIYKKDGSFLFYEDALLGSTATGGPLYTATAHLFQSHTAEFYYIMVNMHGTGTTIQGSTVIVKHGDHPSYGTSPPTQQVTESEFYWTHDGTQNSSYSPYYFSTKPSPGGRPLLAGFYATSNTNFRLQFHALDNSYLGQYDAILSNGTYTISGYDIPGNPEYYYIILVNMHGTGTQVSGNFIHVKNGNW